MYRLKGFWVDFSLYNGEGLISQKNNLNAYSSQQPDCPKAEQRWPLHGAVLVLHRQHAEQLLPIK